MRDVFTDLELLHKMRPPNSYLEAGLRELCKQFIRPGMKIVEIGCFAGASSRIFLEYLQHGEMICVDPWRLEWLDRDTAFRVEKLFDDFYIPNWPRVRKFRTTSVKAATEGPFKKELRDFIYIDGDHRYDAVTADLHAWWAALKPGGYMAGHDYSEEYHPGVVKAVDDFFGCKCETVFEDFSWIMQKA